MSLLSLGKIECAVGTIIETSLNQARKPAYCLTIDFGSHGIRQSSAQLTESYDEKDLINRQVIAVINLPVKRVAGFKSEVLVLAAVDPMLGTRLISPDTQVPNGTIIA